VTMRKFVVDDTPVPACYHLETNRDSACTVCGLDMYEQMAPIL
jgi:hypothetical protein